MPKYLDLFAGAGGLSEGFVRAGFEPIAHVEMDVAASYSLKTRMAYHWLKQNTKLNIYPVSQQRDFSRRVLRKNTQARLEFSFKL